jgi:NAD-dependent deacetylase
MSDASRLAELISEAGCVVALTGAGISVPSGIPDFRTPRTGLWANVDPMEVAHIDVFRRDPARFWRFYGQRFQSLEGIRPNPAHQALVELEGMGKLTAVITQNIDRLHHAAGSRRLIEVHGTIDHCTCLSCGARYLLSEVRERLEQDPDGVPRCDCTKPLKPGVVLFGEYLPEEALRQAEQLAGEAELMIAIGTSLEVYPVAQLPEITLSGGGQLALITTGPTPYDNRATLKLQGDVVDELGAVVNAVKAPGS